MPTPQQIRDAVLNGSPAFRQGFHAAMRHEDRTSPYPLRTRERYEWFNGWDAAQFIKDNAFQFVALVTSVSELNPADGEAFETVKRDADFLTRQLGERATKRIDDPAVK